MFNPLYFTRNILFICALSVSLTACSTVESSLDGIKNTVADLKMPDLFALGRDDDDGEKKTRRRAEAENAQQANEDLPPVVAKSPVVTNPEDSYRADLAALGLDDSTNATLERTEDNTYVFRENESMAAPPVETAGTTTDCPEVSLVRELKALHQFADPYDPTIETKISDIEFTDVKSTCQVRNDTLVVDIDLAVKGMLGPKGRYNRNERPSFSYPYFLAITGMSGNIIAKDIYAFTASYGTEKNTYYGQDTIRQIMPMPESGHPEDVSLLIGFQLTPEELAYNRTMSERGASNILYSSPAASQTAQQHLPDIQPAAGYPVTPVSREPMDITSD